MFQDLYKQKINKNERQEVRRQQLLEQQKLKRLEQQDDHRNLEKFPVFTKDPGRKYKRAKYTRIEDISLQLSEWMKEIPEDINDWLLVPCPKGQRCLVVAARGETKMFSKQKRYRMTFSSYLPGGGLTGSSSDSCILDCVYNKELDTFYVLDVLSAYIPLMECDTEFRFFWLKSKFAEIDEEIDMDDMENIKSFKILDSYDMANEERVAMALQKYPLWMENQPELDGFLFYHKHSNYVCGSTPLVCWLFPFMVSDVLQMCVSSHYLAPNNYNTTNPLQYMDEFDQEMARKYTKRRVEIKQMDFTIDTDSHKAEQLSLSPTANIDVDEFDEVQTEEEMNIQRIEDNENSLKSLIKSERLFELEG